MAPAYAGVTSYCCVVRLNFAGNQAFNDLLERHARLPAKILLNFGGIQSHGLDFQWTAQSRFVCDDFIGRKAKLFAGDGGERIEG